MAEEDREALQILAEHDRADAEKQDPWVPFGIMAVGDAKTRFDGYWSYIHRRALTVVML
jgi:hypothetical protein